MSPRLKNALLITAAALATIAVLAIVTPSYNTRPQEPATIDIGSDLVPPSLTDKPDAPFGLGTNEGTVIQTTDPKTGQLIREMAWKQLTPGEAGVFDLKFPQARFHLAPWRIIQMRSDEGRFVAPGNHPQSGDFRKNVAITIFQTDAPNSVNLADDSPHRILRIDLDQATFDTTVGELQSDSNVLLTTPVTNQIRFAGKGMRMLYNELARRIEYLEITQGDSLRYIPSPAANPANPVSPAAPQTTATSPNPAAQLQYYRVEFERDIHVVSGQRTIDAQKLVVFFTLDRSQSQSPTSPALPAPSPSPLPVPGPVGSISPHQPTALATAAMRSVMQVLPLLLTQVGPDSAALPSPSVDSPPAATITTATSPAQLQDEVVLTWAGRMIMTPVDFAPQPMTAGMKDVYAVFEGSPVTVVLGRDRAKGDGPPDSGAVREQLVCRTLEYLESAKLVTASGSESYPLRITSPEMTAAGQALRVQLDTRIAQLSGAGSIRAAETAGNLPRDFKVTWTDAVDLTFTQQGQSGGIDSANFRGNVAIDDRQLRMRGQQIAVAFGPAGSSNQRQLRSVDASGNVEVVTDTGSITSQTLRLETTPDATGRLVPSRLIAQGNAKAIDPRQQIAANSLDVRLGPKPRPASTSPATTTTPDQRDQLAVEIRTLTAIENVSLHLANGTVVRGEKLDADAVTGKALLIGSPVVITRKSPAPDAPPLSELHVLNLNLADHGRIATSDGAGKFIYTEPDDAATSTVGRRVRVTWTDSMKFEDKANVLQVSGNVVAEAEDSPTELNRLSARQMTLELIDPDARAAATSPAPAPAAGASPAAPSAAVAMDAGLSRRQLQILTARQDVVLLATKWHDASREKVLTRFRLAGPLLTFRQADQLAQITGPGSMLVEDYRETGDAQPSARRMTGRGATLFTWSDSMAMDATRHDLAIVGNVEMTHRPAGGQDIMELRTQRLTADMAQTRHIRAVGMTKVQSLDIRRIDADGNVQIRVSKGDDLITADKMVYEGAPGHVTLTADENKRVIVARLSQPKPLRARAIRWNLKDDSFEIIDAGL